MFFTTTLLILGLNAGGPAPTAPQSALHLDGDAARATPWSMDVGLRSPLLGLDGNAWTRERALVRAIATPTQTPTPAQAATQPAPATADATTATTQTSGEAASAQAGGQCESCDIDCETCRESDRQARYVMRRRASILRTHRAFALAALGGLAVTEVLGTFLLVNRDSAFGQGACSSVDGSPVLGRDFGCGSGLTALHLTSSIITTALYTTAGVLAVAAPDPENASEGDSRAARTLRLHKVMGWVHGAGMVLMPLLGILSARPQMIGIDPITSAGAPNPTFQDFQSAMRTTHAIVGFSTLAALSFAAYLELF